MCVYVKNGEHVYQILPFLFLWLLFGLYLIFYVLGPLFCMTGRT